MFHSGKTEAGFFRHTTTHLQQCCCLLGGLAAHCMEWVPLHPPLPPPKFDHHHQGGRVSKCENCLDSSVKEPRLFTYFGACRVRAICAHFACETQIPHTH